LKRLFTYNVSLVGRFFALLSLLCATQLKAQVRAELDSTKIKIGEELRYRLVVESDTTDIIQFPEGQTFLPLEVIEAYPIDTAYNQQRQTLIREYGLTQFDSGQYLIPRQRVIIGEKAFFTDSLLIEIDDVVVDTTKQKMFDIRERMDVGKRPANLEWIWIVLLLAAIGGGVYWFLKRKKEKAEAEAAIPPYEEAIAALKALDESPLAMQKGSKDYYSALTEIVKRYLDREVDSAALESTSAELITRLQMHKDAGSFAFSDNMIKALDSILKRADLVKFAKQQIAPEIAAADRQELEQVVNQTKEAIPEPTEEELLEDLQYQEELRKQQLRKRWIIGTLAGIGLLVITTGILAATLGVDYLKDNLIGHPTKELVESTWYLSEYGDPAVIIETPEILVRKEIVLPDSAIEIVKDMSSFSYGSYVDNFYIAVNTTEYKQPIEPDMDAGIEAALKNIEAKGAQNLFVKQESFETDKGIKGVKAYGSFNATQGNGKLGRKLNYEMYLFGQTGASQQVVIVSEEDDPYAKQLIERIVASIELEVNITQPQIGKPQ
jgi:hypothetical protein